MSITAEEFVMYESDWICTLEASGRTREQAVEWMQTKRVKPRVRVKMGRQRINAEGLKLWDPFQVRFPWHPASKSWAADVLNEYHIISHNIGSNLFPCYDVP